MDRRRWLAVTGLALLFVGVIGTLQFQKYRAFGYNGLDLGIYSQVVWSLAHGQGFASSVHDPSYLGDHVELWLVPVAGLYRLWPSPLLLLWLQTIILALSVWPIALLARRLAGPRLMVPVAALWLLHPFLFNPALYEFHGLAFALPILAWSIWWYMQNKLGWWLLALVALAAVREDMPIIIAGWGLLAMLDRRNWRWWLPAWLLAVAWFIGAQTIIQLSARLGEYKYLAFYRWLGETPGDMLTFPFRHPLLFLSHIFSAYNWQTVISFVVVFGLLPLWGLRALWPVALAGGQIILLGADAESLLRLHYVIPFAPFFAWAALQGWQQFHRGKIFPRLDRSLVGIGLGIVAIIGPLYGHVLFGAAELPWRSRPDVGNTDPAILQAFVNRINPEDRLLTTFNLLPALANRPAVYSLNYLYLGRRQYTESPYVIPTAVDAAIIDWQQFYHYQFIYKTTAYRGFTGPERIDRFFEANNLELVDWIDGVALYRREGLDPYVPTQRQPGRFESSKLLTVLETHIESPRPSGLNGYQHLPVTIAWWVGQPITEPLSIRFRLLAGGRQAYLSTRLLGQGTRPSLEWSANQIWQTNYRLAIPGAIRGSFTVEAEVEVLTGRMRLDRWRSFSPVISSSRPITYVSLGTVRL